MVARVGASRSGFTWEWREVKKKYDRSMRMNRRAAWTSGSTRDAVPAARIGPSSSSKRRSKARVACAASLLRWTYFMAVHGADWDPVAASGGHLAAREAAQAA